MSFYKFYEFDPTSNMYFQFSSYEHVHLKDFPFLRNQKKLIFILLTPQILNKTFSSLNLRKSCPLTLISSYLLDIILFKDEQKMIILSECVHFS